MGLQIGAAETLNGSTSGLDSFFFDNLAHSIPKTQNKQPQPKYEEATGPT